MRIITPDYYSRFKCVGGECPDNCCIGWEIDINDNMYEKYMSFSGTLEEKLKRNIVVSEDGCRCFKLTENERCPFLNDDNLCEIIISAGEEMLCDICNEHPRFHNCFGGLRETGVGLSCIKASEMILSNTEKVGFSEAYSDEKPYEIDYDEDFLDYLIQIREIFIEILQDRNLTIAQRAGCVICTAEKIQSSIDEGKLDDVILCSADLFDVVPDYEEYICILKELIPLNEEWNEKVNNLSAEKLVEAGKIFNENETAGEQLLVYYIFRHFLSAVYDYDIVSKVKFAVFCTVASFWIDEDIVKGSCLVSKEIEYCSENIDMLLDFSWTSECMRTGMLLNLL